VADFQSLRRGSTFDSSMTVYRIHLVSPLAARIEQVWEHASSIAGINEELAPLRMSAPPPGRLSEDMPLGVRLFRSRVTLGGLIPIDLHDLTLVAFTPGRGFHESSSSLLQRRWIHRRTLDPYRGGCALADDLSFEPRLVGGVAARIVARVFLRRHHALRRKFGEIPDSPPAAVDWL